MKSTNYKFKTSDLAEIQESVLSYLKSDLNLTETSNIDFLLPKIIYTILLIIPIASCGPGIIITKTKHHENERTFHSPLKLDTSISKSRIKVFLTFDDGPNKGTPNLMKLLDSISVPATFFMVGSHIFGSKAQSATYHEMITDTNFIIANHSFNHAHNRYSNFYNDPARVLQDFHLMKTSINQCNNFARTPGRNIWRIPGICCQENKNLIKVSDILNANDFLLIGWDVEWKTRKSKLTKSPAVFLNEVKESVNRKWTKTHNSVVILLHDQDFQNMENINYLKNMIDSIKTNKDYEFCKISEYPGININ